MFRTGDMADYNTNHVNGVSLGEPLAAQGAAWKFTGEVHGEDRDRVMTALSFDIRVSTRGVRRSKAGYRPSSRLSLRGPT